MGKMERGDKRRRRRRRRGERGRRGGGERRTPGGGMVRDERRRRVSGRERLVERHGRGVQYREYGECSMEGEGEGVDG